MSHVHPVYAAMGTTIFEHMSALARSSGAINLGQGFPDEMGPADLLEAAARALIAKSNQYPPSGGLPELRDAIVQFYRRRQGFQLSRDQVIVTSGATEAIAAAVLALVNPGDEVILFQPAYDAYEPLVRRAGGVPVSVSLSPPEWRYDAASIEAVIGGRTKLLIFNDPLNPSGTTASEAELAMIAALCCRHGIVAICDEVWEHVRFDRIRHRSLSDYPGMAERAVKIGSAGKIFGLTGWKIGWVCASASLAEAIGRAHQFLTFTSPPALQWAVAEGLTMPDAWFAAQLDGWASSRSRLAEGLAEAGFEVMPNSATWFLCVDLARSGVILDDREFSERAVHEAGVATIPVSSLFAGEGPRNVVRLCFAKSDVMLDEAASRLAAFRRTLVG